MTYDDFLHRLITVGIESVKADPGLGEHRSDKLAGAIDGFMECRGLQPDALARLLADARTKSDQAFVRVTEKEISDGAYWRACYRTYQIEWVANCVSVMLVNQGIDPILPPTASAVFAVARIVGVRPEVS